MKKSKRAVSNFSKKPIPLGPQYLSVIGGGKLNVEPQEMKSRIGILLGMKCVFCFI